MIASIKAGTTTAPPQRMRLLISFCIWSGYASSSEPARSSWAPIPELQGGKAAGYRGPLSAKTVTELLDTVLGKQAKRSLTGSRIGYVKYSHYIGWTAEHSQRGPKIDIPGRQMELWQCRICHTELQVLPKKLSNLGLHLYGNKVRGSCLKDNFSNCAEDVPEPDWSADGDPVPIGATSDRRRFASVPGVKKISKVSSTSIVSTKADGPSTVQHHHLHTMLQLPRPRHPQISLSPFAFANLPPVNEQRLRLRDRVSREQRGGNLFWRDGDQQLAEDFVGVLAAAPSAAGPDDWAYTLAAVDQVCGPLGVPWSPEKEQGFPGTVTFAGIQFDIAALEMFLSPTRTSAYLSDCRAWLGCSRHTKSQAERLLGWLQFACCVVLCGRPYLTGLIDFVALHSRSGQHRSSDLVARFSNARVRKDVR
ncbi:unnamed protein product [Tilletia caries]|nr:unnamed protein product [Tilletia caries]